MNIFDWFEELFDKIYLKRKERTRFLWEPELKELDDFRANQEHIENNLAKIEQLTNSNKRLQIQCTKVTDHVLRLREIVMTNGWTTPDNWKNVISKHLTFGGKNVQLNTFICINDKELKRKLMQWGLHKLKFPDLVYKLADKLDRYIDYKKDKDNENYGKKIESWENSNVLFKTRKGDCEGTGNLYQACMHILSFGDKSRCVKGPMYWKMYPDKEEYHVWNQVLLDGEWIDVDPTNYTIRNSVDRYGKPDTFWNYYGVYVEE